jgi:hypothetical protein
MPDTDAERELVSTPSAPAGGAAGRRRGLALDLLLGHRLVATVPDGGSFGKADDLEAHRSGALRITKLVQRGPRPAARRRRCHHGGDVSPRLCKARSHGRHAEGIHPDVGARATTAWRVLGAHLSVLP